MGITTFLVKDEYPRLVVAGMAGSEETSES